MKKLFTKLMAVVAVLILSVGSVGAADVQLRFNASFSSVASRAFSTTDVLYAVDAATMSTSTSSVVFASPNNYRVQLKTIVLELKSTSAAAIKVYGMSSGATSTRTIYQVSVADELTGTYTLIDDVTTSGTKITSNIYGQVVATSETAVTGLNIPMGKFVKISFCTSTSGGSTQNVNISGFDITPLPSGPMITEFIAAGVTATINQTAKTITAELPYGTNLTAITPTVTLGGSATSYDPPGAQNFSAGAVNYIAKDGNPANDVTYAVTLTSSATASSDKTLSAVTIGGLSPVYDAGTKTYSIILPKASSLTQAVVFTKPLTASANFTSGNTHDFTAPLDITVTAQDNSTEIYHLQAVVGTKNIAYVTATGNNDPYLRGSLVAKGYYVEDVIAASQTASYFADHDLAILFDVVNSANTLALSMKDLIGTKRFLNLKAYMYGKSGWPTGSGYNFTGARVASVSANYVSHPIFAGLTFDNNNITLVDAGVIGNGIQGATTPGAGTSIATMFDNSAASCIIEDNTVESAMYLMLGFANGNGNGLALISADGKKLMDNSVAYLLGDTKYLPSTTTVKNINKKGIYFDGKTIHNPNSELVQIFDAVGRKILSSSTDIESNSLSKGIYFIRVKNENFKIIVAK